MSSVLHTLPKDLLLVIMSYVDSTKVIEVSTSMNLGIEDAYWTMMTADRCSEKTPKQIYHLLGGNLSDTASCIRFDKPHLLTRKSFSFGDLNIAATHGSMKAIRHILNATPRLIKETAPLSAAVENWNTTSNLETIHLLLKLKMPVSLKVIERAIYSYVPLDVLSSLIDKHMSREKKTTLESKPQGRTMLGGAFMKGRLYCVELLMSKGCKLKYPGRRSCMYYVQCEEDVKFLLDRGFSINEVEKSTGMTPLFSGDICDESVEALIKHGANLNHQDKRGYTPLMAALDNTDDEVIEALLRRKDKMDLSLTNGVGKTYLAWEERYHDLFVKYDMIPEGYVRPVVVRDDSDDESDDYDETDNEEETDNEDDE